jgi:hypothetical protein
MSPLGLGTKNLCTGEGQQQFSSQSEYTSDNRRNVDTVFYVVRAVSNTQYVVKGKSKLTLTLTLSQRGQIVNYGHESRGTRNQESLCWQWTDSSNLVVSQSDRPNDTQKDRPLPSFEEEAKFLKHTHVRERTNILVIDIDET